MIITFTIAIQIVYMEDPGFRHLDPYTVREDSNLLNILDIMTISSQHFVELNITYSYNYIKLLRNATIPDNIRDVLNRVLDLYQQYIASINKSITYLDKAEKALDINDFILCEAYLQNASMFINISKTHYLIILDSIDILRISSNIILIDKINRVINNIENTLNTTISKFNEISKRLEIAKNIKLIDTVIHVAINTTTAFYGDYIKIYGRLTDSKGIPLSNKIISIQYFPLIYIKPYTEPRTFLMHILTDSKGNFNTTIPLYTCGDVSIKISLLLQDKDKTIYKYSESILKIHVNCKEISLKIYADKFIVGKNNTLCIESTEPNMFLQIKIPMLNIKKNVTLLNKKICTEVFIPSNVSEGLYDIYVESLPMKGAPPTFTSMFINISKLPIDYHIEVPKIVFTGFRNTICIYVHPASIIYIYTSQKSELILSNITKTCIDVPLSFFYIDSLVDINIVFNPVNSSYRYLMVNTTINVISTPVVISMILLMIFIILNYSCKRVSLKNVARIETSDLKTRNSISIEGIVGEFIQIIEKFVGIAIERSMTLREYLQLIVSQFKEGYREIVIEAFEIAERILYGPKKDLEGFIEYFKAILQKLKELILGDQNL